MQQTGEKKKKSSNRGIFISVLYFTTAVWMAL